MDSIKAKLKKISKYLLKHERILVPLILFIFSSLLCISFIRPGYNIAHDSDYHLTSTLGLGESREGKLFTRMWGDYGFGEGMFYPQLGHYFTLFISKIISPFGLSVFTAMKIANVLLLFFSGLTMYYFLRTIMGKKAKWSNLLASMLYMGSTYHTSCVIIRDAMAEVTLYVFIPVVALSLYYLMQKNYKQFFLTFVLGVVGCINSHLVMTIWLALLCMIFALVNFRAFFTKKNILFVVLASIVALLITCSFWGFMLVVKSKCTYYAFTDGITSNGLHLAHQDIRRLLFPMDGVSRIRFYLDFVALFICGYVMFLNKKMQKEHRKIVIYCAASIAMIMLLCIGIVNISKWPAPFYMIQFAWRLVTFSVFFISLATAICLNYIPKKQFKLLGVMLVVSLLINTYALDASLGRKNQIEDLGRYNPDYLPIEFYESEEDMNNTETDHLVITPDDGKTTVMNMVSDGPASLDFDVETNTKAEISMPRIYYYGYEATLEYSDGHSEKTPVYYDGKGFAAITVESSVHVKVRYTGGTALPLTRAISAVSATGFATTYAVMYIREKRHIKTRK